MCRRGDRTIRCRRRSLHGPRSARRRRIVAVTPGRRRVLARARRVPLGARAIPVVGVSDLILLKLHAVARRIDGISRSSSLPSLVQKSKPRSNEARGPAAEVCEMWSTRSGLSASRENGSAYGHPGSPSPLASWFTASRPLHQRRLFRSDERSRLGDDGTGVRLPARQQPIERMRVVKWKTIDGRRCGQSTGRTRNRSGPFRLCTRTPEPEGEPPQARLDGHFPDARGAHAHNGRRRPRSRGAPDGSADVTGHEQRKACVSTSHFMFIRQTREDRRVEVGADRDPARVAAKRSLRPGRWPELGNRPPRLVIT